MFEFLSRRKAVVGLRGSALSGSSVSTSPRVLVQALEPRQLLHGFGFGGRGFNPPTITFAQAPAAVQAGLTTLATTDNVTAPASTDTVYLGNRGGVETYTYKVSSPGTQVALTVDVTGNPYNAPVRSTTTFGAITNSAVTAEINAIAAALNLTAPTADTGVVVLTPSNGTPVYTVVLKPVSTTSTSTSTTPTTIAKRGRGAKPVAVSVDGSGNPVGNQNLPFSVLPATLQAAINAALPTGSAAIDAASTQSVAVRTASGVTTYSVTLSSTGTSTTVTVNAAGQPATLPSVTSTTFSALPAAIQTALQSLATAKGYASTIAADQAIRVFDEGNGTTIYAATLGTAATSATNVTLSAASAPINVAVDQNGNPTVPPARGNPFNSGPGIGFGDGFGRGHRHGPPGGGDSSSGGSDDDNTSGGSTSGTSAASGSTTPTLTPVTPVSTNPGNSTGSSGTGGGRGGRRGHRR